MSPNRATVSEVIFLLPCIIWRSSPAIVALSCTFFSPMISKTLREDRVLGRHHALLDNFKKAVDCRFATRMGLSSFDLTLSRKMYPV